MFRTTAASALVALTVLAGAPASASATDDVRAAMLRLAGLSSYEMTFGTGMRRGTIDLVKPDSMHMVAGPMEMVRIGTTSYMKMGPRGWTKMPNTHGAGPAAMADKVRSVARDANGISATDLGMKSVDGETLHAYTFKAKELAQNVTTVYVAGDCMIHRMDTNTGPDSTIRFSKFNAVPPIRAPI